jgi:hypothetical protein
MSRQRNSANPPGNPRYIAQIERDPIPMMVPVALNGVRHYLYAPLATEVAARGAAAVYAKVLCGVPCGPDAVLPGKRVGVRNLPECAACRAQDEILWPHGNSRRFLR